MTSERRRQAHAMIGTVMSAAILLCTVPALADDTTDRALPKLSMCRGCHGIARYRTAFPTVYSVPKLGGQQALYIVKALQDYKRGLRTHPTMQSIVATLTDSEVAAIAAYYAGGDR